MTRRCKQIDHRQIVGGSDARILLDGNEVALLCQCGGTCGEAEPADLSGSPASPSASLVGAAHAEFVGALGQPPRPIPVDADAIDLEDRADHISKVLGALSAYVAVILDDTAQNVPGRLDLPYVEAVLADLASDVAGTIQHAAEDMAGRVA
jgi:hypothetical protein